MREVSLALVHHPVLGKNAEIMTSTVTNIDLHDLSRSARTYGCARLFAVHPVEAQRELVRRICEHWTDGASATRIPDRKVALAQIEATPTLEAAYASLGGREAVEVWVTSARPEGAVRYADARETLKTPGKPVVILFGTSWGLPREIVKTADLVLEPINALVDAGYNHLSVRAACAITLDRLLGRP